MKNPLLSYILFLQDAGSSLYRIPSDIMAIVTKTI